MQGRGKKPRPCFFGIMQIKKLVLSYYRAQRYRLALESQARMLGRQGDPVDVLLEIARRVKEVERAHVAPLKQFCQQSEAGRWLLGVYGIGPVLAAGLLAWIDPEKMHSHYSLWCYAGLAPGKETGNRFYKRICWLAGKSFVKFAGRDECYYGKIYLKRKQKEWERNLSGYYSELALSLAERFKKEEARAWYVGAYKDVDFSTSPPTGVVASDGRGIPMLAPGYIDARAIRYAVKKFLRDYYNVLRREYEGEKIKESGHLTRALSRVPE